MYYLCDGGSFGKLCPTHCDPRDSSHCTQLKYIRNDLKFVFNVAF